jgi:hypothetical protein
MLAISRLREALQKHDFGASASLKPLQCLTPVAVAGGFQSFLSISMHFVAFIWEILSGLLGVGLQVRATSYLQILSLGRS